MSSPRIATSSGSSNPRPAALWRDRLDERGSARALAIVQRHELPELLARVLAGRGVEVDEAVGFLDPTVRLVLEVFPGHAIQGIYTFGMVTRSAQKLIERLPLIAPLAIEPKPAPEFVFRNFAAPPAIQNSLIAGQHRFHA